MVCGLVGSGTPVLLQPQNVQRGYRWQHLLCPRQVKGQWSLHGRAGPLGEVVSTPEERRKQLEEEEPKRGRGQKAAPAMCWGLGVVGEPCQPRDLEGEPHLLGLICMLPAPPPRTLIGVSPSSSVHWPVPAITGPRIPEKVVPLRRIPGPSFDHRKWWLGEGRWPESSQESRGLLLCSRAANAF